jgi:hypothetical protein
MGALSADYMHAVSFYRKIYFRSKELQVWISKCILFAVGGGTYRNIHITGLGDRVGQFYRFSILFETRS